MITLVQHASGKLYEKALRAAEPWHAQYCADRGYAYRPGYSELPNQPTPGWCKILRISEALETAQPGDMVVWLDADTLIVDVTEALDSAVKPNTQVGAVRNVHGEFNAGALWVRVDPQTRKFAKDVIAEGPEKTGPRKGRDQGVINRHMSKLRTEAVHPKWNHYFAAQGQKGVKPVVRAWHGYTQRTSMVQVIQTVRELMGDRS